MKTLLILLAVLSSACTGPFGFVMGGERVHELYNQRHNSEFRKGFATDYHTPNEKLALQRELDRKRGY